MSLLVSTEPTPFPVGFTKQNKELSAPLSSLHPNHPLSNREGTTGLPSATNLGQIKAKSARISHYTCFPSSLSPERTRERRGILRFPSIETEELQTTQGSHFAPNSHHRSQRCEGRDEARWRIRRRASYWRTRHKWKHWGVFFLLAATSRAHWDWKREWNSIPWAGSSAHATYMDTPRLNEATKPGLYYERGRKERSCLSVKWKRGDAVTEDGVRGWDYLPGCGCWIWNPALVTRPQLPRLWQLKQCSLSFRALTGNQKHHSVSNSIQSSTVSLCKEPRSCIFYFEIFKHIFRCHYVCHFWNSAGWFFLTKLRTSHKQGALK